MTTPMTGENQVLARRFSALRIAMAPIVPFLDDDAIIEIMLNADGAVWVDRIGDGMARTDATMTATTARRMLELVASAMNTEISDRQPSLPAILPGWGARLQAMVPPVSPAPVFTIRKPPKQIFTLQNYVERGILTNAQADALREAVASHQNILVGGSTGAGKTTLVNAILDEIARSTDRVYIVEDIPELQCVAPNKVQLFVQPNYPWQRAIMDAMRSRPDRIVVGEVRDGAAALDLVKAWNTGHPGGLSTIHANDTAAMLNRLCSLIEEVAAQAPRAIIAETINIAVHIRRDPSIPGGRSLSGLDRVRGVRADGHWDLEAIDSRGQNARGHPLD